MPGIGFVMEGLGGGADRGGLDADNPVSQYFAYPAGIHLVAVVIGDTAIPESGYQLLEGTVSISSCHQGTVVVEGGELVLVAEAEFLQVAVPCFTGLRLEESEMRSPLVVRFSGLAATTGATKVVFEPRTAPARIRLMPRSVAAD